MQQNTKKEILASKKNGVDLALDSIRKTFGQGSICCLGKNERMIVDVLPTGIASIDQASGVGGVPRGRIIETFGGEGSGKTTLCLQLIAASQKRGGTCAFIDVEHALDPSWAKTIGVNIDDLLVSQPDCGEEALAIAESLIRSNSVEVIVIDSVAALVTRQELQGEMGDATVGSQARLMSQAMRRLTAAISKTGCICVFTNQIRERIGVMFGNPETTPGGRALKFFSSMRIEVRKKELVKGSAGVTIGQRAKLKFVKNKVAAPFTECEVDILYSEGISRYGSLLDVGLENGVLEKKGAWIAFGAALLGQGRDAAIASIKEQPEVENAILKALAKIAPAEEPTTVELEKAATASATSFSLVPELASTEQ